MFCHECSTLLSNDAKFCNKCGAIQKQEPTRRRIDLKQYKGVFVSVAAFCAVFALFGAGLLVMRLVNTSEAYEPLEYTADALYDSPVEDEPAPPAVSTEIADIVPVHIIPIHEGGGLLNAKEIFAAYSSAVFTVYISFDGNTFVSRGTGFVIEESGIAVTAHSNLVSPYVRARFRNGKFVDIIGVYNYCAENDAAVIQLDGYGFQTVRLGNSNNIAVAEHVYLIGSNIATKCISLIGGIVASPFYGTGDGQGAFLTSINTHPGKRGSPVFNANGHVIGVSIAGNTLFDDMSIASRVEHIDISPQGLGTLHDLNGETLYPHDFTEARMADVLGIWEWEGGFYEFNADGTGYRRWHLVDEGPFYWRVAGNAITIITERSQEEHYLVELIDFRAIVIGGSYFERIFENPAPHNTPIEVTSVLAGEWTSGDVAYIFNADGSGWRDWGFSYGSFYWRADFEKIIILPENGTGLERWSLSIVDDDNINITGTQMLRTASPVATPRPAPRPAATPTPAWTIGSAIAGTWVDYLQQRNPGVVTVYEFNTDGTGRAFVTPATGGTNQIQSFTWSLRETDRHNGYLTMEATWISPSAAGWVRHESFVRMQNLISTPTTTRVFVTGQDTLTFAYGSQRILFNRR